MAFERGVKPGTPGRGSVGPADSGTVGKRTLVEDIPAVAEQGISGPSSALPYRDQIQRLFGRHDIGHVKAHVGGHAMTGATSMGAEAFAMGDHVAFSGSPTLHTAAHEAAHVVQQRAGVQLKGGVGEAGDPYEQHADQVADLVVQGKSSEHLLSHGPGAGASSPGPVVQRRQIVLISRNDQHMVDSGMSIQTENVDPEQLERLLTNDSLDQATKLELMRAIDAGEVRGGLPAAYAYATQHLAFFQRMLPTFGAENEFSWIRRITGGGSGSLTGKRDANGIKTDMTDHEYLATTEITTGFYDTAAAVNGGAPRDQPLTLYRGFTIPELTGQDAPQQLAAKIAGFSDVLPSSSSWQREEAIAMSAPAEHQSAVLLYMCVPPNHPIVIMSYPDNSPSNEGEGPPALDIGQAETLVGASTFADPRVFRTEQLDGGRVRYHVSVTLVARNRSDVLAGIQHARQQAASTRAPAARTMDVDPDDLENKFGGEVAGEIRNAREPGGIFQDLDGRRWTLEIIDDMFGYTFQSV